MIIIESQNKSFATIIIEFISRGPKGRENNSSVWLESNGPGTEKFEGELYIPRDELSFSEVVVEVSCQKPSVARFWQAVTKTEEKESSLEEWKVSLRFWTVPGPLLFSHTDTFFSHFRDCSNHKSDIRRVLCNFRDRVNLRGAAEPRIINFRRGEAELRIFNFNSTWSRLNLRNSKSSNLMKM